MFIDVLENLCALRGEKLTPTIQKLGISPGNIGTWKKGGTPYGDTLVKLADYFNVSTDCLLERVPLKDALKQGKGESPVTGEELADLSAKLAKMSIDDRQRLLFTMSYLVENMQSVKSSEVNSSVLDMVGFIGHLLSEYAKTYGAVNKSKLPFVEYGTIGKNIDRVLEFQKGFNDRFCDLVRVLNEAVF